MASDKRHQSKNRRFARRLQNTSNQSSFNAHVMTQCRTLSYLYTLIILQKQSIDRLTARIKFLEEELNVPGK